jgi:hypothetical protein
MVDPSLRYTFADRLHVPQIPEFESPQTRKNAVLRSFVSKFC